MTTASRFWLRILVLGLLLPAWWNPPLPWRAAPGDIIILLDDSLSMERATVAERWSRLADDLARLPAGSRFALVRFAATPVLATPLTGTANFPATLPPRPQALDRSAGNLEAALAFGLRLADPRRPTVLILFSDGAETQGQAQKLLQTTPLPIYGIEPSLKVTEDAWIADLTAPAVTRPGQRVPVTVVLASTLTGDVRLQWWVNDRPQKEYPLPLEAGKPSNITLWCPPLTPGANRVEATVIMPGDRLAANDSRTTVINVAGATPVIYLSAETDNPAPAVALQRGHWPVRVIPPQALLQQDLANSGVVILDDIAVDAMMEPAWSALAEAVRRQGTGLIVLGGPHSFGGGAYRHSTLESLLPVIAAGAGSQASAAVLFMVDKSGSMEQADTGLSRLALARRAVAATALALPAGDWIGLLAFDSEPQTLLPLGNYPNPAPVLEAAWRFRAGGGTRLRPALLSALEQLQAVSAEQRLLVLVTDGFVESEDYGEIERRLEAAGITPIALAVGAADNRILHRLADHNGGRLLPVRELATLPRLMQQEVEQSRDDLETDPVIPQQLRPFPYELGASWPVLRAYRVTQARPEAQVYLQAPAGDPLLAMWQAGAGRVVALPGGLGDWAREWWQWPEFGRFLGGLLEWVANRTDDRALQLQLEDSVGALHIRLDSLGEDRDWDGSEEIRLSLQDPHGRLLESAPNWLAPGRAVATIPVTQTGQYRVMVRTGERTLRQDIWHEAAGEFQAPGAGRQNWERWLQQGLIQPWPAGGLNRLPGAELSRPLRTPLLLLAGLLYVGILLAERSLLPILLPGFWILLGRRAHPTARRNTNP